jgi:UDP-N-acetyl-D-galactosamine dehydrogenase
MGQHIAMEVVKLLMQRGRTDAPVITILGLTFKENVPDLRNSKVIDIISTLQDMGITVQVTDAWAAADEAMHEYGVALVNMQDLRPADGVVLAVAHKDYVDAGWDGITSLLKEPDNGFVFDIKAALDRNSQPAGVALWRM